MNNKRYTFFKITILFITLLSLTTNIFSQHKTDSISWQSYKSDKYNFEITYPKDYFLKIVSDQYILLRKQSDDKYKWRISINIETDKFNKSNGDFYTSYDKFTNKKLKIRFDADGVGSRVYGDSVVSSIKFVNKNKIDLSEHYVNVIYESYSKVGKKTQVNKIRGPIFLYEIRKQTLTNEYRDRAVIIATEDNTKETENILREIIKNFNVR